jgi:tetratricopeptide (TPR) repeat protein
MGRFDKADAALSAAERLAPDMAETHQARWRLELLRGNREGAHRLALQMISADEPQRRWAALAASALGRAYAGHIDAALEDLREAKLCEPEAKFGTALISAALLFDVGRCRDAERMADRFLDSADRFPEHVFNAHLLRAACQARDGKSRAADAAFVEAERALKRIPERRRAGLLATVSGFVALESHDLSGAVRHLSRATRALHPSPLRDDAGMARVWFALGTAQLELGETQEAEKWFRRLADSQGERLTAPVPWLRSHYSLARIYDERGDTARALEHYARFLEYWADGEIDRERVAEARGRIEALSA